MKKIIIITIIAAAITGICSCKKDFITVGDTLTTNDGLAYVQIVSSTVNAARNYAYIDGAAVNGAAFAYSGIFPASTTYGFGVRNGSRSVTIKDTLVSSTQAPLTFNENFETGKKYTIFTYDTITAPKKLTVVDNIVIPTDTTARLRFANFIYNTTAVPAVDVFSFKKNANVFTNVPTAQVTDFIPFESSVVSDTLYVRETGTAILLGKVAVSFGKQRIYTAILRGSYKGTKAVATFITY